MKITKALITAAGFGTRFLPITKTIQKEMLPLLDRPIIDYVVDDLIAAGVTDIIFVISEHNSQLIHYYRENQRLLRYLTARNKTSLYDQVAEQHQKATFHFIHQKDTEQYGTAVPLKLAQPMLQDEEAFFVFMGDDLVFNADGYAESAAMIQLMEATQAIAVATCVKKPADELYRYGVVKTKIQQSHELLDSIVEKPTPGNAPSNLVNISKYIFTPRVFEVLAEQTIDTNSGELYITDTITKLAETSPVAIHIPKGMYLDGGNPLDWLKANITVGLTRPDMAEKLVQFFKQQSQLTDDILGDKLQVS